MPALPRRLQGWLLWLIILLLGFGFVTFLGLHYKLLWSRPVISGDAKLERSMPAFNLVIDRQALIRALEAHLGAKVALDLDSLQQTTDAAVKVMCMQSGSIGSEIQLTATDTQAELVVKIHAEETRAADVALTALKSLLAKA